MDEAVRSHRRCDLTVADLRFDLAEEVANRVVGSELVQQPVVDHRPHPVHLLLLPLGRQLPVAPSSAVQLDLVPDLVEALVGQAAAGGDGRRPRRRRLRHEVQGMPIVHGRPTGPVGIVTIRTC